MFSHVSEVVCLCSCSDTVPSQFSVHSSLLNRVMTSRARRSSCVRYCSNESVCLSERYVRNFGFIIIRCFHSLSSLSPILSLLFIPFQKLFVCESLLPNFLQAELYKQCVCVFAPPAALACLVACATVCVHLFDEPARRHARDDFPLKLQPQQVSTSLERPPPQLAEHHLIRHFRPTPQNHSSHLSLHSLCLLPLDVPPNDCAMF